MSEHDTFTLLNKIADHMIDVTIALGILAVLLNIWRALVS